MHMNSLFSKTGKGLLEIKYRSHQLPEEAFRVLCLIDGRTTFGELVDKSRIAEIALGSVLTALANNGYIKELIRLAAGLDVPNCAAPPAICEGTAALSSAQGTVPPTAPARASERFPSTNTAER
jgi:hypothetical protein